MINVAYRDFRRTGATSWAIGAVSDAPGGAYLWHYWMPVMLLLDQERFRLCALDEALAEGTPFLYPVELRWEFLEWLEEGMIDAFLTPHIPSSVLEALGGRRALLLVGYGHEARRLSYTSRADGKTCSVYDRLLAFVEAHNLPPGAVLFINGNLNGDVEYQQWKAERHIGDPAPFDVRGGEYYSYMTKMMRRLNEDGRDIAMQWDLVCSEDGLATHAIDIEIKPLGRPLSDVYARAASHDAAREPTKLFLCMNRITREHRRHVVVGLEACGLLERCLVSFKDDEADTYRYHDARLQAAWERVQQKLPLAIDRNDMPSNWNLGGGQRVKVDEFFYVKVTEAWPYRDCSVALVTETQYRHDLLFPSEKIWKPIVQGLSFVVAGTPGLLAYLRSIGFRTFSPVIDEGYDLVRDNEERMRHIYAVIESLGKLSQDGLRRLREVLRPATDHNLRHLQSMVTPMEHLLAEIVARLQPLSSSADERL